MSIKYANNNGEVFDLDIIQEAPEDGAVYTRRNGEWVQLRSRVSYTSTEAAVGISVEDDQQIAIDGNPVNITISNSFGIGFISFIAGQNMVFNLPIGFGWDGDKTPVFEEGKFYNVSYTLGTFYADNGRGV